MGDHGNVAAADSKITFKGAESKVKAATSVGGSVSGLATVLLYTVGKVTGLNADMPDAVQVALLGVITAGLTGLAAFYAGWRAKHTHRADLRTDVAE